MQDNIIRLVLALRYFIRNEPARRKLVQRHQNRVYVVAGVFCDGGKSDPYDSAGMGHVAQKHVNYLARIGKAPEITQLEKFIGDFSVAKVFFFFGGVKVEVVGDKIVAVVRPDSDFFSLGRKLYFSPLVKIYMAGRNREKPCQAEF